MCQIKNEQLSKRLFTSFNTISKCSLERSSTKWWFSGIHLSHYTSKENCKVFPLGHDRNCFPPHLQMKLDLKKVLQRHQWTLTEPWKTLKITLILTCPWKIWPFRTSTCLLYLRKHCQKFDIVPDTLFFNITMILSHWILSSVSAAPKKTLLTPEKTIKKFPNLEIAEWK